MGKKDRDHLARAEEELTFLCDFFEQRLGADAKAFQKNPVMYRNLLDFWVTLRSAAEGKAPPTYPEHPEG